MDDLSITLNNKAFSLASLKDLSTEGLTVFEKATVDFCKSWISNEEIFLLNTSGSTGDPKQITVRRDQMRSSAKLTQQALQLHAGMTSLVCLDPRFIAGKMMLVRSLTIGMNMIIVEPTANPFLQIPSAAFIHFAAFVPYQIHTILNSDCRNRLNSLTKVIIGGSKLPFPLTEQLQTIDAACYATYGMTETISHIALQELNGPHKKEYFEALDGVSIGSDHRSCLTIKAIYLGDVEIVTNDLIDLIGPRQFKWLGRWDNVINTGGMKVIPEKIEKIIEPLFIREGVHNRFFIYGTSHALRGQQVALIIEGSLKKVKEEQLMSVLKKTLEKYELPGTVLYADTFIETSTGKVKRKESAEIASPRPDE